MENLMYWGCCVDTMTSKVKARSHTYIRTHPLCIGYRGTGVRGHLHLPALTKLSLAWLMLIQTLGFPVSGSYTAQVGLQHISSISILPTNGNVYIFDTSVYRQCRLPLDFLCPTWAVSVRLRELQRTPGMKGPVLVPYRSAGPPPAL